MAKKSQSKSETSGTGDEEPQPSFEVALSSLESIVRRLEDGQGTLEQSLEDYSKAIDLLKGCHVQLESAQRKIEILSGVDAQGNPIVREIEEDELSLEEKQQNRSQRRTAGAGKSSSASTSKSKPSDPEPELF